MKQPKSVGTLQIGNNKSKWRVALSLGVVARSRAGVVARKISPFGLAVQKAGDFVLILAGIDCVTF
jgi:hypothetical protein